ncbi:YdcF family protein [Caulobacter sp. 17J65-9]|uniref:YdcF family protein n=1 Tax=Caulobacter sp. 17J65-9 TaxID=2709382 RepID=UPI0013C8EB66|nr:YdcF family protein [Caulobacter sp. 17J65-9]NEX93634.1 YdcF family protein [Caulobacter sp. 17J65-9]
MKSLAAVAIVALIWLAGLLAFAERVQRSTPADEPPQGDGVVVLTGASDERIVAAMHLLEQGKGRRLLVSGVNREVTRGELRAVTRAPARLYDCCVDLGFEAADTIGNAQEIAAWARAKNFTDLVVVTSDYHMPRSLLEIRGAMPEAQLVPYAVRTPSLDTRRWWRSATGARRMTVEYCKYLVVLVREAVLSLGDGNSKTQAEASPAATA